MLDKILVLINLDLDRKTALELDTLLEERGYQAFFMNLEWQDTSIETQIERANALKRDLQRFFVNSRAAFVCKVLPQAKLDMPVVKMPASQVELITALDGLFAS